MPNPFPGMNPYMENPRYWRGVHLGIIYAVQREINQSLPEGFATYVEERVYIEDPKQDYYPDATVTRREPSPIIATVNGASGGVAVLTRPATAIITQDAPVVLQFARRTVREPYLEIRTVDEEELIAVIEVLSPTNKEPGPGQEEYLRKQRDLLASSVHFLEIDLLRAGEHTVAPPGAETRQQTGPFDYFISLHRGDTGERYEAWPRTVRDRLPRVHLPLTEEAGDVPLDLQMVIDRSYDDSGIERRIDYRKDPVPPLARDEALWADALLREKGLR